MKKLTILLMFMGIFFTGCEPMEDIHEEVDASLEIPLVPGELEYTMVEEDYIGQTRDGGLGLRYPNFSSLKEAQDLIPEFLRLNYPVWGPGSVAYITFDINAAVAYPEHFETYTVTTEDYDAYEATARFDNFDDMGQIYTFLNDKFSDAENKTLVILSYKFFEGSVKDLTNGFLLVNGEWQFLTKLDAEAYTEMGEGHPNFSSIEEAEDKLPIYLNDSFKYQDPQPGQVEAVLYEYFDGRTNYGVAYFVYDGETWSLYDGIVTETLQFGFEDGVWFTDNTITHTLDDSDFAFIAEAFEDIYEDPAWSAGRYSNFDVRTGGRNTWTEAMVHEALVALLDGKLAPDADEGQKYVLTYLTYNGDDVMVTTRWIKLDGTWVIQD